MLTFLRRYRSAFLIAAVLVAAVYLEVSHAHGPREQSYAAAPPIAAPAPSQRPAVSGGNGEKTNKTDIKGNPDIARGNSAAAPNSVPPKGLTFAPRITVYANPSAAKGENDSSHDYINYALIALGVVVAFFTYRVINRQADIMARTLTQMGKDAELARDEFNATFRPHLIVRNVHAIDASPGDEIAIKFELINNGSSRATVVASDFEINFVPEVEIFQESPSSQGWRTAQKPDWKNRPDPQPSLPGDFQTRPKVADASFPRQSESRKWLLLGRKNSLPRQARKPTPTGRLPPLGCREPSLPPC